MSCTPFETLSAFADAALPELESATVAGHVHSCPSCRTRLDELRWLKDAVRSSAPPALATEEFKARLVATAAQFGRRRRRVRLGALGAGLGVALAALLLVPPFVRDRRAMAELIGDHVDITVTREEAFDVSGDDPSSLERWFIGKLAAMTPSEVEVAVMMIDAKQRPDPLAFLNPVDPCVPNPKAAEPIRHRGEPPDALA